MKRKVHCLFVWPKANSLIGSDNWPLYGSLVVATYAQAAGACVDLVDRRRPDGLEEFHRLLGQADIVLVAATTADITDANIAIQAAKEAKKTVMVGGVHGSALQDPFEDFPLCDCVVRGDGMAVIGALLADWSNGTLKKSYISPSIGQRTVERIDALIPDRSLLPKKGKEHPLSLITELGCPNSCSFCFDANPVRIGGIRYGWLTKFRNAVTTSLWPVEPQRSGRGRGSGWHCLSMPAGLGELSIQI